MFARQQNVQLGSACQVSSASCCPTPGRAVWYLTAEQQLAEKEMPLRSQAVLLGLSKLAVTLCPSKGVTVPESGEELPQSLTAQLITGGSGPQSHKSSGAASEIEQGNEVNHCAQVIGNSPDFHNIQVNAKQTENLTKA